MKKLAPNLQSMKFSSSQQFMKFILWKIHSNPLKQEVCSKTPTHEVHSKTLIHEVCLDSLSHEVYLQVESIQGEMLFIINLSSIPTLLMWTFLCVFIDEVRFKSLSPEVRSKVATHEVCIKMITLEVRL